MRRFVLGWKVGGHERRLDAHIVNYADDFVICGKPGKAAAALTAMRTMMEKLRLTVNEKKTRRCSLPEEAFTFLGFTFERQVSRRTGRPYIGPAPAKKKVQAICDRIREATSRSTTWRAVEVQVTQLNQLLRGWGNYFRLGFVTGAWRVVQQHACQRLRRWLRRKHGQPGGVHGYPDLKLYDEYGLVQLTAVIERLPLWA